MSTGAVVGGGGGGIVLPNQHGKRRQKAAARSCTLRSAQQQQQGDPDVPLFFVIHSLDCRSMWQHKGGNSMLEALIELVGRPGVHLVASVDHLNAPLLFSAQHLEALSWVWHDVTTLAPYMTELSTAHSSEKDGGQSYLPAGEGLKYLLQCVTKRHLELLQFLASRQLEEEVKEANRRVETAAANKRRRKEEAANGGGRGGGGRMGGAAGAAAIATEGGITFEDLAQQCADKMISRSHGNLRQLFDELLDHRLLKSKGMGTKTRYWIPRSTAELKMIVNYREK